MINRLGKLRTWHFLLISVICSEVFTLALNSLQSILRWGHVSRDLIEVGVVDAFFVSIVVTILLVPVLRYTTRIQFEKGVLQKEIAERKQTDAKLIYIMKAVESASDAIGISDSRGHHFYQNKALSDLFGYATAEELEAAGGGRAVIKDPEVAKEMFDNITHGKSWAGELEMVTKSGRVFTAYERADTIRDNEGNLIGLIGIITDITDRKLAEDMLRESEQNYRTIFEGSSEGIVIADIATKRLLFANSAYRRMYGYGSDDSITSLGVENLHPPDAVQRAIAEFEAQARGEKILAANLPCLRKDGMVFYADVKTSPAEIGNRKVVVGFFTDVTEKKLIEEERLKLQKLESIGTLAGGIAHDFNNLLQGVFGYISLAKINYDQKEKSLAMLEQAEEALHMSLNLTTQLLTFSKGGKPVKKLISLGPAIERPVKFALSGSHTNYEMDVPADLWFAEADEGQLAQVIQNIVLNANQAMAGGGTVRVSLANVDTAKQSIVGLRDGEKFVRITIQDSGIGIPENILPRVFDPYFTTKQKGSGLGLATAYSIIKNHSGVIEVKSEVGRGTIFTIYLPAVPGVELEAAGPDSHAVGTINSRILVMDDEDLVRNVAIEMILAMGHDVVGAEDGTKAIALFRQAMEMGNPFDLVILDLTVKGGMGGEEAVRKILDLDPNVKAVVSSGYADSPVIADYQAYGFSSVLSKPYTMDALKNCFNQCIAKLPLHALLPISGHHELR